MGFIRGVLSVAVCAVLFLSLFLTASFLNLSMSLKYETLKEPAADFAEDVLNETGIWKEVRENFLAVEFYCSTHYNYILEEDGFYADIPCEKVNEGSTAFLNSAIESLIFNVYYDSYDCEFWNCVTESKYPLVLLSEKAQNYWQVKFKQFLILSAILFGLLFLFIKKKSWTFILTGILTIVSAVLFRKVDWIFSFLLPDFSFFNVIDLFFLKANFVFAIFMIIGIFILIIGILFRIFGIGLKFSKVFKKKSSDFNKEDFKKIVKEEIKAEKQEEIETRKKEEKKIADSEKNKSEKVNSKVDENKSKKK